MNEEIDDVLKEEPDFVYFMRISNNVLKNARFGQDVDIPQLDYISSSVGDYVLLPQRNLLNYSTFCNFSTTNNCQKQFCNCEHLVQVVKQLHAYFRVEKNCSNTISVSFK